MFRDRGYTASTLRDIAAASGMKAGSVYYHFASKDEILVEILDQGLREIYDGVRAVINSGEYVDYRAKIAAAIHAHLSLLLAHSEYTSANIRNYGQLPEAIRERHRPLRRLYAKLWETLLKDAQRAGQLREDIKIVPLRQFLLGALNWTVEWFNVERHSIDALADRCALLVLDGMGTGRSSGGSLQSTSQTAERNKFPNAHRKSDRTRQEILRAAAILFRNRGYAASTLREIAAAAGMKAGSIYYHFDSKDEILDEVLDQGVREVYDGVRAVIGSGADGADYRAKIAAAIHTHLTLLLAHSEFTSANIRIYGQLPENIRERHRPLRRAYTELWQTLSQDAQQAGQLREDIKIVPLRQFLLGALNWTVEWFDAERHSVDELARRCTRLFFEGICVKPNRGAGR